MQWQLHPRLWFAIVSSVQPFFLVFELWFLIFHCNMAFYILVFAKEGRSLQNRRFVPFRLVLLVCFSLVMGLVKWKCGNGQRNQLWQNKKGQSWLRSLFFVVPIFIVFKMYKGMKEGMRKKNVSFDILEVAALTGLEPLGYLAIYRDWVEGFNKFKAFLCIWHLVFYSQ